MNRVLFHFFNESIYGYRCGQKIVVGDTLMPNTLFATAYLTADGVEIFGTGDSILVEAGLIAGRGGENRLRHLLAWYDLVVVVAQVKNKQGVWRNPTYCL
ncbi:hypothetical protein OAU26_03670 [Mariniblastus sp.]|nr:hypothetical protein [Mariniblastus sp.]